MTGDEDPCEHCEGAEEPCRACIAEDTSAADAHHALNPHGCPDEGCELCEVRWALERQDKTRLEERAAELFRDAGRPLPAWLTGGRG